MHCRWHDERVHEFKLERISKAAKTKCSNFVRPTASPSCSALRFKLPPRRTLQWHLTSYRQGSFRSKFGSRWFFVKCWLQLFNYLFRNAGNLVNASHCHFYSYCHICLNTFIIKLVKKVTSCIPCWLTERMCQCSINYRYQNTRSNNFSFPQVLVICTCCVFGMNVIVSTDQEPHLELWLTIVITGVAVQSMITIGIVQTRTFLIVHELSGKHLYPGKFIVTTPGR